MNPIQLSLIGIRLVSIFLIAQLLTNIPFIYLTLSTYASMQSEEPIVSISFIASLGVPFVFAIILWVLAPKFSVYLTNINIAEKASLNASNFQSPVLALIGVYLLVANIPQAITINYLLLQSKEEIAAFNQSLNVLYQNAFALNLKLLFGLILLLGSKSLVKLLHKLRTIGT